ncbi:MAG: hypothetical protein ACREN6_10950 [Gemmatimonadaceae bacterium]
MTAVHAIERANINDTIKRALPAGINWPASNIKPHSPKNIAQAYSNFSPLRSAAERRKTVHPTDIKIPMNRALMLITS